MEQEGGSTLTCLKCNVFFTDRADHLQHFRTEWHRYNLKRMIAELPPLRKEEFEEKLAESAKESEAVFDETKFCKVCNKKFNSSKSLSNHLSSKRHTALTAKHEAVVAERERHRSDISSTLSSVPERSDSVCDRGSDITATTSGMSGVEEDADDADSDGSWETMGDEDEEGIPVDECLFCSHISADMEHNLQHMSTSHSFFIPDLEFVVEGRLGDMLAYLGAKVGVGFRCLWCSEKGKSFLSLDAVQKHMRDKGHAKILFEGDAAILEFADFYDYRSSYPDADMGGEEVEGEGKPYPPLDMSPSGFDLILPSGSTVGHRSLQRYYRQSFGRSYTPTNQLSSSKNSKQLVLRQPATSKILDQYRQLGWGSSGRGTTEVQRRAKDLAYLQRLKSRNRLNLHVKANKFQPHFREQIL